MVMAIGLYTFCGNSGVLAFGHVAFVAIGAYVCGILAIPAFAKPSILPNLPYFLAHTTLSPPVALAVGGVTAGVAAAIVFYPLRKLNAQALSIVTLSLLLISDVFFTNVRLSSSGGAVFRVPVVSSIWSVVPWVLGAITVSLLFQRSRLGLRLRASREDEFAAAAGGIDIGWTRLFAFALSAGIMGVGGGLYAFSIGSFSAADFFLDLTILLFAMIVIGGMRSLSGAVVGSALISLVNYTFSQLQNGLPIGDWDLKAPPGTSALSVASCMIIVLLFRREGLFGDREVNWPHLFMMSRRRPKPGQSSK